MFTQITVKNFKTFTNAVLDLSSKKNTPKHIAVIYGPNGSGKTTIAEAFQFLRKSQSTMQIREMLNELLERKNTPDFLRSEYINNEALLQLFASHLNGNTIESIIREYKTLGSAETTSLQYDFVIGSNSGSYYIEMDDAGIVCEHLEYKLSQRRGCYFSIDDESIFINKRIFETKEFYSDICDQTKRYWGKHTLLSILLFEMEDKSDTFINSNISKNLMDVLLFFRNIYCSFQDQRNLALSKKLDLLDNLQSGKIKKEELPHLQLIEKVLDSSFRSIYSDVEKVFYEQTSDKDKINYRLFFTKRLDNRSINIDFKHESDGTKQILSLLPSLALAAAGSVVIIDEYGIKIHDSLSAGLLRVIASQISGQLIITTHNTMVMDESNLDPEALYFIANRPGSQKQIECITDIEERTYPNYKYRTRYLTSSNYRYSLPEINDGINLSEFVSVLKQLNADC